MNIERNRINTVWTQFFMFFMANHFFTIIQGIIQINKMSILFTGSSHSPFHSHSSWSSNVMIHWHLISWWFPFIVWHVVDVITSFTILISLTQKYWWIWKLRILIFLFWVIDCYQLNDEYRSNETDSIDTQSSFCVVLSDGNHQMFTSFVLFFNSFSDFFHHQQMTQNSVFSAKHLNITKDRWLL